MAGVLLVLFLAACGGGPAPAPSGLVATTDIAAVGSTVTFTGANLGTSGTVEIGGVNASASSWTPTSITVTVPAGAPQGPQQVEVTTGGVTQSVPLFVGVDFPTGTLEQLTALALPKGTAVRLGTGRFESTTPGLALDNLSLYGRGETLTTVAGPAMPDPLYLYADEGYDLVLADLTLETGLTTIVPTPLVTPDALAVASAAASAALPVGDLDTLLAALEAEALGAQATADGSYEMRDVTVTPAPGAPAGYLATMPIAAPGPGFYGGTLRLRGVTSGSSDVVFYAMNGGDIDIADSLLDVVGTVLMSVGGTVTVDASTVTASNGLFAGGLIVAGVRGLHLTGSHFAVANGDIQFLSGYTAAGPSYLRAQTTVTNNTITAGDADTADASSVGSMLFGFTTGTATITGNDLRADRSLVFGPMMEASLEVTFASNTVSVGAPGVATADLLFSSTSQQVTNVSGNTVAFLSEGGVRFGIGGLGSGAVTSLRDNAFTGSGAGTALTVGQADYELAVYFEATGNVFTDFENALHLTADPNADREPFNARINDNVFDFAIDAAPKTATLENMTAALSDLDASRNVWGTNVDAATVAGYVTALGTTEPDVLTVAPLTLP